MSQILKGLISAVYKSENKATVILTEHNGTVTKSLPIYAENADDLNVNDFVLVIMFSDGFDDGVILAKTAGGKTEEVIKGLPYIDENGLLTIRTLGVEDILVF